MEFVKGATIAKVTNAQAKAAYYAKNSVSIMAKERKYRHDHSKYETDVSYLSREFVAWDGEGISDPDGSHRYVMLAVKSLHDGDYMGASQGLGTSRIFDFVLSTAERIASNHDHTLDPIHIIYGGGYDFNMWLKDFTEHELWCAYNYKWYVWKGYRIAWRRGKSFYLCRVDQDGKAIGKGVTIYDCVSFFQMSFVKACDSYLGDDFSHRDMIVANKALRSSFTDTDILDVKAYNDAELENLLKLMSELRRRLNKVGLRPRRWDGPGAVAAALLQRENIKAFKGEVPAEVAQAARYAYAGGRFECLRYGDVPGPAYEYDLNSAYPAALTRVPDLSSGVWEHVEGDPGPQDYALYHVSWSCVNPYIPGPFLSRMEKGTVGFPVNGTNWVWSPEMETGRLYEAAGHCGYAPAHKAYKQRGKILSPATKAWKGHIDVLEAWVYHPTSDVKPFAFIQKLYDQRQVLKAQGDGAQVGIKLALNSLYGKLAQQVGWERKRDGSLRIPPYHQLEWAGYVTSYCRAKVLEACIGHLDKVIAFETDAVFTSEPLPGIKLGTGLGEFELTEFKNLTYVKSGLYFGDKIDAKVVDKTRGVDRGSLTRDDVVSKMFKSHEATATAYLTRFVTAGIALNQSFDRWCRWETAPMVIVLRPTGKRTRPIAGERLRRGAWLETESWAYGLDEHSYEFPVEWLNPNPTMDALSDFRQTGNDWTDELLTELPE